MPSSLLLVDDDDDSETAAMLRGDSSDEAEVEESCASAVFQAFARKIAVLLVASPIAWALRIFWGEEEIEPIYHFFSNFFAIIPIAWAISVCTEHLEVKVGPTWGTLLNSTFGNVVEMILSVQVIRAGSRDAEHAWLFKIVQSSLLGAILMNLLFVLGCCFFVVGLKRADSQFNMHSSIYSLCLLSVASMALVVPTAMATFDEWSTMESRLFFSRGIALCLLAMYVQWLIFTLVSHKNMFDGSDARELEEKQQPFGKKMAGNIAAKNPWELQTETEPSVPLDVAVCPYGVVGAQMTKEGLQQTGSDPDPNVAIVDPAGLKYIRSSPGGAGGAAGALYKWLDILDDAKFPEPVRLAIRQTLDAKLHSYGQKHCIHVVGPDFRELSDISRGEAVQQLALAYKNVMAEFVASNLAVLRLLPISGGIFSGKFKHGLTLMTAQAVHLGFLWLTPEQQCLLQVPNRSVEMCIFSEKELWYFQEAFEDPNPPDDTADDAEGPTMPFAVAVGILLFATVLVSFHCDFLVEAINPVTEELGVKKAFVATVVLPLVGNFSEVIAALSIASKGKLDLAMEIAIASATQIAMVVVPVAVLIGWYLDAALDLDFEIYQVHLLTICILVTSLMLQDGHANWLKGTMLMTTYFIVATSFWFISDREFKSAGDKAPVLLQCNMSTNGSAVCIQMIAATHNETN